MITQMFILKDVKVMRWSCNGCTVYSPPRGHGGVIFRTQLWCKEDTALSANLPLVPDLPIPDFPLILAQRPLAKPSSDVWNLSLNVMYCWSPVWTCLKAYMYCWSTVWTSLRACDVLLVTSVNFLRNIIMMYWWYQCEIPLRITCIVSHQWELP